MSVIMKACEHSVEWMFCTLISAATPWCLPLLIGNSVFVIPWTWAWLADFLICGVLGIIGGLGMIVARPPPEKDFAQTVSRVLLAAAFAAFVVGVLLQLTFPGQAMNPAVRSCACGVAGFFSYPGIVWLANFSIQDLIGFFIKRQLPEKAERNERRGGRP